MRTPQLDMTNWRKQIRHLGKVIIDDAFKARFLEELSTHGQLALAARDLGVSPQGIRNHLKNDPEFSEAYEAVVETHAAAVVHQLEKEALQGLEEPIYSQKTGDLLGHKKVFETPIRLAVLRRYDPNYKDRAEIDVRAAVGVLVAPAEMTPQEWIAQQEQKNLERREPDMNNLDAPPSARILTDPSPSPEPTSDQQPSPAPRDG